MNCDKVSHYNKLPFPAELIYSVSLILKQKSEKCLLHEGIK